MKNSKIGTVRESHSMVFTPAELAYKLFRKKTCPVCRSKMKANIQKENQGVNPPGTFENANRAPINAQIYVHKQYYYCEKCNRNYSISELVNTSAKQHNR